MRSVGRLIVFLSMVGSMLAGSGLSITTSAETFYYKKSDGSLGTTEIGTTYDAERKLSLEQTKFLSLLTEDKMGISKDPITAREPRESEKLADAAVILFTAMIVIATHDTYDLSSDLRLSRMSGIFFFVFPIEASDIYKKCNNEEYLIALTDEPKEETLKQLKSVDEVRRLCHRETNSKPSS